MNKPSKLLSISIISQYSNSLFLIKNPIPPDPDLAVRNWHFLFDPNHLKPDILIVSLLFSLVSTIITKSGLTYSKICSLISELFWDHALTFQETILSK